MEPGDPDAVRTVTQLPEYLVVNPDLSEKRQLLEQILGVLVGDDRVLAVWLAGSFARDEGDAQSDLDVHVAVADGTQPDLLAHWEELIDRMSPTVLKHRLRFGETTVLSVITPSWQRFDLTVEALSDIGRPLGAPRLLLFDRADVAHRLGPLRPDQPVGAEALRSLVEEFFRVVGLLPVVVLRGEFLVGMDGAMLLRRYLIDLMLAENGVSRRGALRLNPLLSVEQRMTLEKLPSCAPTSESVIAAHLACARALDPIARRLLSARGIDFPNDLDLATREYLSKLLGAVV